MLFWVVALASLVACSSKPTQKLDADIFYKRDLSMVINGVQHHGASVVNMASSYSIVFKPHGKLDLLKINTCHREDIFRADHPNLKNVKEFHYQYRPVPGIEDVGSCEMRINSYDKEKGEHSFGFLAFRTGETTLEAASTCNGEVKRLVGVAVCQSKEGLVQRLTLSKPVYVNPPSGCDMKEIDNRIYEYNIKLGECLYLFKSQDSNEYFKLITIGYENVLVRSVE